MSNPINKNDEEQLSNGKEHVKADSKEANGGNAEPVMGELRRRLARLGGEDLNAREEVIVEYVERFAMRVSKSERNVEAYTRSVHELNEKVKKNTESREKVEMRTSKLERRMKKSDDEFKLHAEMLEDVVGCIAGIKTVLSNSENAELKGLDEESLRSLFSKVDLLQSFF
mmetsp:Transcript_24191/g.52166  ORF Transcript_24191/g.52166 Transcript_24191/m.52166 type:complete len:170 (+) Transcript_24191:265-774(+)|eukprot:CAMPEP_0172312620 /NCGR_PEP_ID=MMETSP1058-20130122/18159_1 /TAXON_ID=83371 /ORGANISM="Detonula confervacea, Strain CCMP 353" /LENGTH=169 /DNA_ID=CAMNT_0013026137 /DNA_START=236 /DNA_END=745 /DNA_ORIENTATION=+